MNLIAAQPDLFGEPRLAGLSQAGAIITPAEERALIEAIDATELSPFRFHGWLGKRLTVSYGWRYDFDDASFAPSEAIPDWYCRFGRRRRGSPACNQTNSSRPC
jgi:alkylated DNA repair protein (DNA oxidative demethylase)